jgi:hypothetical protein
MQDFNLLAGQLIQRVRLFFKLIKDLFSMTAKNDHFTGRPMCTICGINELTIEEAAEPKQRCWFCIAENVISLAQHNIQDVPFPSPDKFGRHGIDLKKYEARKHQPPEAQEVNTVLTGKIRDTVVQTKLEHSAEDKKHAFENFGIDLDATLEQTTITVFGTDERVNLRLTMPFPITAESKNEILNVLKEVLGFIGSSLIYSRHFKDLFKKVQGQIPGMPT